MDRSFEDLPIGAEAGSDEGGIADLTPEQIAAGIQFLVDNYKRKTPFTDDEMFFINEFKKVVPVMLDSVTELEGELGNIRNILTYNRTNAAEVVGAFQGLRGLIFAHGKGDRLSDALQEGIRSLDSCLKQYLRDPRFPIVRECCMIYSFCGLLLGRQIESFVFDVLNHLQALLSSKVNNVSPLAEATLTWIYFTIRGPKTLHKLLQGLSTTITIQRRVGFQLLTLVLDEWRTSSLEKYSAKLKEYIKRGLYDTDGDTRGVARKAWWSFSEHWPDAAEDLLLTMAPAQRKQIRDKVFTCGQSRMGSRLTSRLGSKQASRMQSRQQSRGGSPPRTPASFNRTESSVEMASLKRLDRAEPKSRISDWVSSQSAFEEAPSSPHTDSRSPLKTFNSRGHTPQKASPVPKRQTPQRAPVDRMQSVPMPSGRPQSGSTIRSGQSRIPMKPTSISASKGMPTRTRLAPPSDTRSRRPIPASTAPASRSTSPSRMRRMAAAAGQRKNSAVPKSNTGGPPQSIQQLIPLIKAPGWQERRDSCTAIQLWCQADKEFDMADLKRLVSILTRLLSDANSKVISSCLDVIPEVCQAYGHSLRSQMAPLVGTLLRERQGKTSFTVGTLRVRYENALASMIRYIPGNTYVSILIKLAADNSGFKQADSKILLTKQLIAVLTRMSEGISQDPACLNTDNQSKIGITCIISWSADPKSIDLRKSCDRAIQAMQQVFGEEFDKIMMAMPKQIQITAARALDRYQKRTTGASSKMTSRQGSRQTSRQASRQGSRQGSRKASPERDSRPEMGRTGTLVLENRMQNMSLKNKVPATAVPAPALVSSPVLQDVRQHHFKSPSPNKSAGSEEERSFVSSKGDEEARTPQSPMAVKARSNMVYSTLAGLTVRPEVQRIQVMRQLEAQISLDPDYWKKNYEKCIGAIDNMISLLDVENNGDGVRSAVMCALSAIMNIVKILPDNSKLLETVVILHNDESINVSNNAQELLKVIVEKCSLNHCLQILHNSINHETHEADLSFGHTKLLEQTCLQKGKDLQDSAAEYLPVAAFAPSLLQQFGSQYAVLRKTASAALVQYKNLVGEESLTPFMHYSLPPQKVKLLRLYFLKAGSKSPIGSKSTTSVSSK